MLFRSDRKLLLLFLVALSLRLIVAYTVHDPVDRGGYRYVALSPTSGIGAHGPPLYPLFLRLAFRLSGPAGDPFVFAIQAIIGSFLVIPIYAAAARLFGRPAALVAAGIAAVYPNFIIYHVSFEPEWLAVLIAASAAAVAASGMRDGVAASLSGALAAIGLLVRPYFLFMIPGLFAVLKKRFLFLLALLVLLGPLAAWISVVEKGFVPLYDPRAFGLSVAAYSPGDWMQSLDNVYSSAVLLYRWHPGRSYLLSGDRGPGFLFYFIRKYSYLIVLLLGLIALARYIRRDHLRIVLPPLCAVALHIFFTFSIYFHVRALLEIVLVIYLGKLAHDGARAITARLGALRRG